VSSCRTEATTASVTACSSSARPAAERQAWGSAGWQRDRSA
jgi:hypothetical protein